MTDFPRIAKSGDYLWLTFPPLPGNVQEHSISIPANEKGWEILLSILSSIETSPFAHMATPAKPIQWNIEQWLKDHKITILPTRKKQAAKEELSLADLGL